MGHESQQIEVIHRLSEGTKQLLRDLVEVITRSNNTAILTALQILDRKVTVMSSNIDRIEKEASDLAEDVTQVKTAIGTLNTTITDLQATVTDLKNQVAQGQLDQARLDTAATALEKADNDLDAITLPGAPEPTT